MTETNENTNTESIEDKRIVRLNRDKTRKTSGSDTIYQVYFELSGTPHNTWRNIFDGAWKDERDAVDEIADSLHFNEHLPD